MHKGLHVLTTKAEPERPDWLLYDASSAAHYHTDPKLDQSCLAVLGKFSTVLPIITKACQFVSRARRRILCILHCFTWWIVTYRRNLLSMKRCSEKGTSLMASKLSCHATFINHCFVTPRHALGWDSISEDWPSLWILSTFRDWDNRGTIYGKGKHTSQIQRLASCQQKLNSSPYST